MRHGAADYLVKPFDATSVVSSVQRVLARRVPRDLVSLEGRKGMIGGSEGTEQLWTTIERAAASAATVLITGERGTGKELVAQLVHHLSSRNLSPLVVISCGAMPTELLEAELFGHVRGAFASAIRDKAGLFEVASGGTLVLKEVEAMPPRLQVKGGNCGSASGRSSHRSDESRT